MKLKDILKEIQSDKIVYHGSANKFTTFNDSDPIFFSDNQKVAKTYGDFVVKAKVKLDNPLEIDFEGNSTCYFLDKYYLPSEFAKKVKDIAEDIRKYGADDETRDFLEQEYDWSDNYGDLDGIIMKNIKDSYGDIFAGDIVANNYVVFNKSQVKEV